MSRILLLVLFIFSLYKTGSCRGYLYFVGQQPPMPWNEAQAYCKKVAFNHGYLAEPMSLLHQKLLRFWALIIGKRIFSYWTGLTKNKKGKWIWGNSKVGLSPVYKRWALFNRNPRRNCAAIDARRGYKLTALPCNMRFKAVCEFWDISGAVKQLELELSLAELELELDSVKKKKKEK